MRSIRTIGLALVLALTALTAIGAGSASANEETVLCKAKVAECANGNYIGYAFSASGTVKFKLGEITTVQCSGTMERSKTEMVTALTFSGCTEGCTVTATNLPFKADLSEPIEGNGKLSAIVTGLLVKCGGNECVYGHTKTSEFPVTGGTKAAIIVNKTLFEETGNVLCHSSAQWETEYKVAGGSTYVTKRGISGPMFCLTSEVPCGVEARRMEEEFSLAPETTLVFSPFINGSQIKCSEAKYRLKNLNSYIPGGEWRYEPLSLAGCTSTIYTGCTAAMEASPYPSSLSASGKGNGTITVSEPSAGATVLSIKCSLIGTKFTCTYKLTSASSFSIGFTGGVPSSSAVSANLTRLTGPNNICGTPITMTGTFQSTVNKLLYMSSS
jgi:hypothetical protein